MRRLGLIAGACALFGWGTTVAIAGCGGDDATHPTGPEDSGGVVAETSNDGSSGTIDSGSSGSDSSSSGATSNPGKITCGAAECSVALADAAVADPPACCAREAGAAPVCTTSNQCESSSLELQCDETLDCPNITTGGGGHVQLKCCFATVGGGRTDCQFAAQCGPVQVCKSDAECSDGGSGDQPTCSTKKCGPKQSTLRVCGTPLGCQ